MRRVAWAVFTAMVIFVLAGAVAARVGELARASSRRADLIEAKDPRQRAVDTPAALETAAGRAAAERGIGQALTTLVRVHRELHGSLAMSTARFLPYVATQRN